jgi:integrase
MPLNDTAIKNAKKREKPYKLSDGSGLHVLIDAKGSKYWRLAYRFLGKQKTLALGIYPTVTLADARAARDEAKKWLAKGLDPSQARKEQKLAALMAAECTFEPVALEWCQNQKKAWTAGHASRVAARLRSDIFPDLGSRPVAEIESAELLAVLRKVENRGALDLAKRLRQTVGQIFRYAISIGRAKRDPSADLKGALKAAGRQQHHKAMPRDELPKFLEALTKYAGNPQTRLALRLVVLTFVRTTELRAAKWSEVHLEAGEWRIPAERMKMHDPHIVPLSRQAIEVLQELRMAAGLSPFVFPSPSAERYMSYNTMIYALYRMGYHSRATVHGFRAVASTLLNEMGFEPDWIERQLAHDERNKVRAAYNHATYLPERRRMMQHWADYLDSLTDPGKIVAFQRAQPS